jgi:hypothetical protein
MAWHTGNYTLSPGASARLSFWWGDDHGVQFAEPMQLIANDPPPIPANTLRVTDYGTIRNSDGLTVTYFFDFTNDGPGTTNYTAIGFGDLSTGA